MAYDNNYQGYLLATSFNKFLIANLTIAKKKTKQ